MDNKAITKQEVASLEVRFNLIHFHNQSLTLLNNEKELYIQKLALDRGIKTEDGWLLDIAKGAFIKEEKTNEQSCDKA